MNLLYNFLKTVPTVIILILFPLIATAQTSLNQELSKYLNKYDLPSIAAAVIKNGKIVASGATGTRKYGAKLLITINDRYHIGSDTKAMTSLLAAIMVEEGRLRWNSTMAEIFPEISEKMTASIRNVTLEHLLSHTGGIPSDNEKILQIYREAMTQDGNLDEMRYWIVKRWSIEPLESMPGSEFAYSNMGYTIAGAMIERAGGRTWEELITERVFAPLGMKNAGLGHQSSLGKIDAPLGHIITEGKIKPFLAGPNGDVPTILGPAGGAHMSILDFARWAGWNAGEGGRKPFIVKTETIRKLHKPITSMPPKKDAPPGTPPGG